jgi:HAD superfamily hydrolase (TIGR01509 family)
MPRGSQSGREGDRVRTAEASQGTALATDRVPLLPRRSMTLHVPLAAVLLDIDGTLLDSNDTHARSWAETLRRHGHAVARDRVRPLIGMGADRLLAELLGLAADDPHAQRLAGERSRLFLEHYLPSLGPTPGARRLLERLKAEGLALVVATAAGEAELPALLGQAGVADLVDAATTSGEARRSKPDPDIVEAALRKCGVEATAALMLGDTPYDIEAARAAGVGTIALRCGGWWDDAALAGAVAIHDSPAALLAHWEASPLAGRCPVTQRPA